MKKEEGKEENRKEGKKKIKNVLKGSFLYIRIEFNGIQITFPLSPSHLLPLPLLPLSL